MIRRYNILSLFALVAVSVILFSANVSSPCPREANVQLGGHAYFYEGIVNPITVRVSGIPNSNLIVDVYGPASITQGERAGQYNVRVDSSGKIFISIWYMENGKKVAVEQYNYLVKRIPDPVTYVNAIRNDGVILKNDLQKITGVFTRMENFDLAAAFRPQSFSMTMFHDSVCTEYKTTGPALNAEMKKALNEAMPEDRIIFHNVMTKGPDSTLRKVNPVYITVK